MRITELLIKPLGMPRDEASYLSDILANPNYSIPERTKEEIATQIRKIRAGQKGEQAAQYEINFHFESSPNYVVIHNIRLEHKGRVAQIDHLILNRLMDVFVCESKHFSQGISINEAGEFTSFYAGKAQGIPSPILQNDKHCTVLREMFVDGTIAAPTRLGFSLKPTIKSVILVSSNARITRPKNLTGPLAETFNQVIKADNIYNHISGKLEPEKASALQLAKLVSLDELASFAKRIAQHHKPISFDWEARFGLSQLQTPKQEPSPVKKKTPRKPVQKPVSTTLEEKSEASDQSAQTKRLVCETCGIKVEYAVGLYCWRNKKKYGGFVYCKEHQE